MKLINYTLEQCEATAYTEKKVVYYSSGTLWWTDDESDLEEAKASGRAAQKQHTDRLLNDPNVPENEKARVRSLLATVEKTEEITGGIPLDPFGSPLLMIDTAQWIQKAKERPDHFGKYGIQALMKTHHKNMNGMGVPFVNWNQVSDYLDGFNEVMKPGNMRVVGRDPEGNDLPTEKTE